MVMQTMNWMLWPLVGFVLEMKKSRVSAKQICISLHGIKMNYTYYTENGRLKQVWIARSYE